MMDARLRRQMRAAVWLAIVGCVGVVLLWVLVGVGINWVIGKL